MLKHWWDSSVVYQIYPRSFKDSNGDGIGDIPGIIEKLDYLKTLGIDLIWLCPVFKSPQADNGYDISDYTDIDPLFGSLEDMDRLIQEAEKHGIGIMLDLVLNHSSDEHFWFKEAVKSRENPYHDYYVWRDGDPVTPPNDMRACFGGSAWEYVPTLGQYYFHQFHVKQPDLNWENPKLREEIYEMIRNWCRVGVKGFRLDVIDQIAKEPDKKITNNGPKLHEYIQELSRECFQPFDVITVGEAWGADVDIAKQFSNPDGSELSMVFQFEQQSLDQIPGRPKWDIGRLDFVKLKKVIEKWQNGLYGKGWNSLFWNNHDMPRVVSAYGTENEKYRETSAKMLATVLHGLQGTPYVYEGEEIGMTNCRYDISEYRDVEILNMYEERLKAGYSKEDIMESVYFKGRDNARTPMQWDDTEYAGFSDAEPWIKVNPNYERINVKKALSNGNSVFFYYKKLISLRKNNPTLVYGDFTLLEENDSDLFVYEREYEGDKIMVMANFHEVERIADFPEGEILIHNYDNIEKGILRPYEAYMFRCT